MKRILTSLAVMLVALVSFGQTPALPQNVAYSLRADFSTSRKAQGRSINNAPSFFIYPDKPMDAEQAKAFVDQLGMADVVEEHHASVYVINPVGAKYDAQKDFDCFVEVFNIARSGNVKVMAFGDGATFVNTRLAPESAGYIAGILTCGGKPSRALVGDFPGVPAYVAGSTARKVAPEYLKINESLKDVEPLLQVVVNPAELPLAVLFADAWKQVLSKAFRFNNYRHTHYEGCSYGEYGVHELEPYTICEDLGMTRIVVEEKVTGPHPDQRDVKLPTLWYEYWPDELMDASKVPAHSVPVMVLLHGYTNDPRTQAETSGFIEVAGRERFFVVEMEWQGSSTAAVMGYDGIEATVFKLLRKYPQLDPSRVYAEGLSAGSMTASALGLRKPWVFAAVGGHSGAIYADSGVSIFSNHDSFSAEARMMRGHFEMPYFSIACTADRVVPFFTPENYKANSYLNAWNIYQTLNGMEVVSDLDFSLDPVFGQTLANRRTIRTAKGEGIVMEMGDMMKGDVPMIRVVAVMDYGHWNFKPTAQLMWDYFKHFSRDPQTKELIFRP